MRTKCEAWLWAEGSVLVHRLQGWISRPGWLPRAQMCPCRYSRPPHARPVQPGCPLYKLRGMAGPFKCPLPCVSSTSPPSFQDKLPEAPGAGAALHGSVAGGGVSGTVLQTWIQLLAYAPTYSGMSVCFDWRTLVTFPNAFFLIWNVPTLRPKGHCQNLPEQQECPSCMCTVQCGSHCPLSTWVCITM